MKHKLHFLIHLFSIIFLIPNSLLPQEHSEDKFKITTQNLYNGLKFRNIGPAFTSGRIGDFAVDPNNRSRYFVAVSSGGVWKTENAGTSWKPVFDNQASYSIGCIAIDPTNTNIVWVGSGENNSQRSVSYGDGVYKSEDGGKTWKNMGLKTSEHIGKILIDPRDGNTVYVASQGPLWNSGGERGLYKTTDGGESWELVLEISENTGVTDIAFDPRNPNEIYAASYQRRRHVWTLINGGEESAIYKTHDAGKTWKKLTNGIPSVEKGRIGLAVSPVDPDYVFALIETADKSSGLYLSTNRGASWKKQCHYKSSSAQYYQEIFCDPVDKNKLYSLDTWTKVSIDAGKTWKTLGNRYRHVDDHAFWIDQKQPNYILIGGDGGIYESFDAAKTWKYVSNLPVTQFYRITADNDLPFYNVYGGTQDNNSMGGPSQTLNLPGIVNSDWFITNGGDGYESQIDPKDPNIVYAQSQYGGLVKYNKAKGEKIGIKPTEPDGAKPYRWNWNSPLIISPHNNHRLYFAANILFRSEDMGNSWKAISGDLSRQLNRDLLPVFGKIQSVDAVSKNASTSQYGNIVSLSESPIQENLIYVGTDDGLIQISEDAGNWTKTAEFKNVPEMTYVSCIEASKFEENVVYASFDNRKRGDFLPYILKSSDKGKTWKSIRGDLPENLPIHSIAQDHMLKNLIFIGTEFGVYFTLNEGENWVKLTNGLPTISIRDIDIQERENDLVLATFGRGIYILDDYSPLRDINSELLNKPAYIFPIKNALHYIQKRPYGYSEKAVQGEAYFTAENPPFGACFTYYFPKEIKTLKQKRKDKEKKSYDDGAEIEYPSYENLKIEDEELKSKLLFVVYDENGNEIRKLYSSPKKGINRIYWDLRHPTTSPAKERKSTPGRYSYGDTGPLVNPGKYFVSMFKIIDGEKEELVPKTEFQVVPLNNDELEVSEFKTQTEFLDKVYELKRSANGFRIYVYDLKKKVKLMKIAADETPEANEDLKRQILELQARIQDIIELMDGDPSLSKRNIDQTISFTGRIGRIIYDLYRTTEKPTDTHFKSFKIASSVFEKALADVESISESEIPIIEEQLEKIKAPYTPGRLPKYKMH